MGILCSKVSKDHKTASQAGKFKLKQRWTSMLKRHWILLKRINVEIWLWNNVEIWCCFNVEIWRWNHVEIWRWNNVEIWHCFNAEILRFNIEIWQCFSIEIRCWNNVENGLFFPTLKSITYQRWKLVVQRRNLKSTLKQRWNNVCWLGVWARDNLERALFKIWLVAQSLELFMSSYLYVHACT